MVFPNSVPHLQLGLFRLEDICVRLQEDMAGYLRTAGLEKTPGIDATFRWLARRGVRVALLSDHRPAEVTILLERLGWAVGPGQLIDCVLPEQRKYDNPVRTLITRAGLTDGSLAFSMFDTPRLLRAAHFSRVAFNLGVTNGQHGYGDLAGAPHRALLDTPVQLADYLVENLPEAPRRPSGGSASAYRLPLLRLVRLPGGRE